MLCARLATRKDGFQFPCGQCQNCRINKRRDWQARLLLEAATHENSVFVTLTFADVGTPQVLRRAHIHSFTRNLHQSVPSFRYFGAAEYGTKIGRAHYHLHIFSDTPIFTDQLCKAWPCGHVHVGNTEPESIDYVLGYLLKASKVPRWPIELQFPEFRIYSQGMGKNALSHLLIDGTELPREFKVFGRKWPIGRYLRDRAKKMGYTISERDCVTLERFEAQAMRSLLSNQALLPEQAEKAYQEFHEKRQLKSKQLQQKAIRAAYLEQHGHVKKANNHETF